MNPKTKKVLAEQASQVGQALKWVGGAIFGDADDVLDDMAKKGDEQLPAQGEPPPRAKPLPPKRRPPPPARQVIDVEGFIEDEDDDDDSER